MRPVIADAALSDANELPLFDFQAVQLIVKNTFIEGIALPERSRLRRNSWSSGQGHQDVDINELISFSHRSGRSASKNYSESEGQHNTSSTKDAVASQMRCRVCKRRHLTINRPVKTVRQTMKRKLAEIMKIADGSAKSEALVHFAAKHGPYACRMVEFVFEDLDMYAPWNDDEEAQQPVPPGLV
eukprot:TRINITY_DN13921_c0_g2_i1.p1 TRINITY_DN13921_c0_g2~~TRINITY_DN13921_c0_g2_i1.p1  ORF type:complete len:207 (-),score=27.89 TRINITY_DN13921_c0_g2_i1:65-619(-)